MSAHPDCVQNSLIVPYTKLTCSKRARAAKEDQEMQSKYCRIRMEVYINKESNCKVSLEAFLFIYSKEAKNLAKKSFGLRCLLFKFNIPALNFKRYIRFLRFAGGSLV